MESFADSFNVSVVDYVEEVELYEEVLEEVMEINEIAGRVVDLVSIQFHRYNLSCPFVSKYVCVLINNLELSKI